MARKPRIRLIDPTNENHYFMTSKLDIKLIWFSRLTLAQVAGLTPEGYDVRITDENVGPIDFEEDIDLVGITAMSQHAPRAYEIAARFRKRGISVVMGGVHATMLPYEAKKHVDAVLIGEAEGIWDKLLDDYFKKGRLDPFYKAQARPNLKSLPHPRRDLLNKKAYSSINCVETTRGCPFDCEFCSVTAFAGGAFRMRPVQEVVEEISKMNTKSVVFIDDNIIGNPRYAKKLFEALIPLNIRWGGQASTNIARNKELLQLAAKSGCFSLFFGIETLSSNNLRSVNKNFNRPWEYEEDFKRVHDHGIRIIGSFIFGFDYDDEGAFERTVNFVRKNKLEIAYYNILTPLPGTRLFKRFEDSGRLLHKNWEHYNGYEVVFKPTLLTPESLQEGFHWTYRETYSYPSILKRISGNIDSALLKTFVLNWAFRRVAHKGPKGHMSAIGKILARFNPLVPVEDKNSLVPVLSKEFAILKKKGLKTLEEAKSYLSIHITKSDYLKSLKITPFGSLDSKSLRVFWDKLVHISKAYQEKIVIDFSGIVFCSKTAVSDFIKEKRVTLDHLGPKLHFENAKAIFDAIGEHFQELALPNIADQNQAS